VAFVPVLSYQEVGRGLKAPVGGSPQLTAQVKESSAPVGHIVGGSTFQNMPDFAFQGTVILCGPKFQEPNHFIVNLTDIQRCHDLTLA
jgi:hypothetical protein